MGPPLFSDGDMPWIAKRTKLKAELQWGRRSSATETLTLASCCQALQLRFNGAAALQRRRLPAGLVEP